MDIIKLSRQQSERFLKEFGLYEIHAKKGTKWSLLKPQEYRELFPEEFK